MAKDAKGHGSEARSGHEHAIAKDTVKNPLKGVFLGGPTAAQAEAKLRSRYGYSNKEISNLKGGPYDDTGAGHAARTQDWVDAAGGQPVASNAHAAATLASGPKSVPVDVHPAQSSSPKADAFYKDLGGRQAGQTFPKHGYTPNNPGNRPGNKPTDL